MSDTGLSIRIDQHTKDALDRLAKIEGRKLSGYVRHKLTEIAINDGVFKCSDCKKQIE